MHGLKLARRPRRWSGMSAPDLTSRDIGIAEGENQFQVVMQLGPLKAIIPAVGFPGR